MKRITRREFLKFGVGAIGFYFLPRTIFTHEKKGSTKSVISVARGDPSKLVQTALLGLGGIDKFIKAQDRVLIKPNLSFSANNKFGTTTSPEILTQVVKLCFDAGAKKIIICDHTIADPKVCKKKTGVESAILNKKRVTIFFPNQRRQYIETEIPGAQELKKTEVAKVLQKVDKIINLPTAKSHSVTGVSLGLKNLMGLIWNRGYLHRLNLHQAIAELSLIIKPDLTIVDATRVLTSGGPGGPGKTRVLNTVVAGTDPVAVDSYTVGISSWYDKSFRGKNVKHIVAAAKIGLGKLDAEEMQVVELKA